MSHFLYMFEQMSFMIFLYFYLFSKNTPPPQRSLVIPIGSNLHWVKHIASSSVCYDKDYELNWSVISYMYMKF